MNSGSGNQGRSMTDDRPLSPPRCDMCMVRLHSGHAYIKDAGITESTEYGGVAAWSCWSRQRQGLWIIARNRVFSLHCPRPCFWNAYIFLLAHRTCALLKAVTSHVSQCLDKVFCNNPHLVLYLVNRLELAGSPGEGKTDNDWLTPYYVLRGRKGRPTALRSCLGRHQKS